MRLMLWYGTPRTTAASLALIRVPLAMFTMASQSATLGRSN